MTVRQTWLAATLLSLFLAGCGSKAPGPQGVGEAGPAVDNADSNPLRVAAAADLQRVLPKLIEEYRKTSPGPIEPVFGPSGRLAEHIRQGAPVDVFLSADRNFVDELSVEGLIVPDSVRTYARGSLVLVVHKAEADSVATLADLNRPEIRKVAIANPQFAPYGRAASQVIKQAGLAESLEPKLVRAESVRLAYLYAQRGDAEAAFVSRALIEDDGNKVIAVDSKLHEPIDQSLGIVSTSGSPEQAARFVDFLVSDAGRAILDSAGFERSGAESPVPRP